MVDRKERGKEKEREPPKVNLTNLLLPESPEVSTASKVSHYYCSSNNKELTYHFPLLFWGVRLHYGQGIMLGFSIHISKNILSFPWPNNKSKVLMQQKVKIN